VYHSLRFRYQKFASILISTFKGYILLMSQGFINTLLKRTQWAITIVFTSHTIVSIGYSMCKQWIPDNSFSGGSGLGMRLNLNMYLQVRLACHLESVQSL